MADVSRGPILIGKKLRAMSVEGGLVPGLVESCRQFDTSIRDRIEDNGVPNPVREIPERLLRVFERVTAIALLLPFTGETGKRNRRRVLDETELLMHDMCGMTEYLRDLLHAIPQDVGKKSLASVKARLDVEVELLFRAPINAVKHKHFKLAWLEAFPPNGGNAIVKGFFLNGPLGRKISGPAPRRFGGKAFPDGYSYPLLLRKAICSIYTQCDIVENAIHDLIPAIKPASVTRPAHVSGLLGAVKEALMHLSVLPRMGFPLEQKHQMKELVLDNDTVRVLRTFKLANLRLGSRLQFEVPALAGHTFAIPYWEARD